MTQDPTARRDRRDAAARAVLHPRPPRQSILRAIGIELRIRPTVTTMTIASVFVGGGALVLGTDASRAFTELGGQASGALIVRVLGAALFLGGLAALAGVARLGTLVELMGLGLICGGNLIYAAGVFVALGWNGWIAGGWAAALCFGSGLRVVLLTRAALRLFGDPECPPQQRGETS